MLFTLSLLLIYVRLVVFRLSLVRRSWLLALIGVVAAGCAADTRLGRLEHLLRAEEDRVTSLESRLASAERELSLARRQADDLRAELSGQGTPVLAAEQADALYRAERLSVVKVLSGGVDLDDLPGHDAAVLQFVPVDADGDAVKLPGDLDVELLDPATDGERVVAATRLSAAEVRDRWQAGPLASGFHVRVPFETPPTGDTLVAHATLTTADGRRLEATEMLRVRPAGQKPDPGFVATPESVPVLR
ncbi:MAG: hypothetical protein AAGJ97_06280 [Planctomycetota bacterium]